MVASLGVQSRKKASTCHPELILLANVVVRHFDLSVLEGHREPDRQVQLFREKKTRTLDDSAHLLLPSDGIDMLPYPIDYEDWERMIYFGGFVMATAALLRIPLIWGGDWDHDQILKDERWRDLAHFERRSD